MGFYRPLAATLFFYECLRLLTLVTFFFIVPLEGFVSGILPVYLSSNALFPLMTLFAWIKPEEYRNFHNLYIAGKVIILVSFFAWQLFTPRDFLWLENAARSMLVLGGYMILNFTDILSVYGAWTIKNKYRGGI